jgi:hypothetical protein
MSIRESGETANLQAIYGASSEDFIVRFSREEKRLLYRALFEVVPEYRSRIRIFSPRCSLYALCRQYGEDGSEAPYPCRGGLDFFCIDSQDCQTYPCGYRGSENLGKYWDLKWERADLPQSCLQCDWECFRDPSELFGPLLQVFSAPLSLMKKVRRERGYFGIWYEDLRYYMACDLFNGRKPPCFEKLAGFHRA